MSDTPLIDSDDGRKRCALIWRNTLVEIASSLLEQQKAKITSGDSDTDYFVAAGLIGVVQELDRVYAGLIADAERVKQAIDAAQQLLLFQTEERCERVYFQTDGEYIKIGRTVRSETRRRKENQTGNPRPITTLAVIPRASENRLHERFKADHVRGEWYRISDDIMAFVKAWQTVETAF